MIVDSSSTEKLYYTETDHLGSIIGLINPDGTYAERYSYDAWGRRRNPSTWEYDSIPEPLLIDRGFTGHEHIDEFGLINMNGRVYDPYIGRFLSVDPVVQFPDNSQSYTGYSYCLNNPLVYTDPSGYSMSALDNGPDPWGAYIQACMKGYTGGYGNFSDQYYDKYYNYMFSDGGGGVSGTGGGGGGFTINWKRNIHLRMASVKK